jgi:hypothetical protein
MPRLQGSTSKVLMACMFAIFAFWGFYRVVLLQEFVRITRDQGVVAYNDYNTKQLVRSGLVVYLIKNPPEPGVTLYSNEPEALYFFLRRMAEPSPADRGHYIADLDALKSLYPRWPAEESAYLVWFRPNIKRQYYNPGQLETLAQMEKLYKRYDGDVYLVKPKE